MGRVKLLDTITVETAGGEKRLELYYGDLTEMRTFVDLLIISASPRDYIPTPGSLIAALHRKGIVVAQLALTKELELREPFSCWLSSELDRSEVEISVRRILCLEPHHYRSISELIRGFFQALITILSSISDIKTAAMPVVFSGGGGLPESRVVEALMDGAVHWMALGLPLDCLKIVVHNHAEAVKAAEIFSLRKPKYRETPLGSRHAITHDVFISYAHENAKEVDVIIENLRREMEGIRIFLDRDDLRTGGIWQHRLFTAIDTCKKMVALLSPEYISSTFCIDEFNIAMIRGREEVREILYPIYLYSAALPTYIRSRQWSDCREGNAVKLVDTCRYLVRELENAS